MSPRRKNLLSFLLLVVLLGASSGAYRQIPYLGQLITPYTCHPFYSGCLNIFAFDYDCLGGAGNGPQFTGELRVEGWDIFSLDRDGDGMACESSD